MKVYRNWLPMPKILRLRAEFIDTDFVTKAIEDPWLVDMFSATLGVFGRHSSVTLVCPRKDALGTGWHRDPGDISGIVLLSKSVPLDVRVRGQHHERQKVTRIPGDLIALNNNTHEHLRRRLTDEEAAKHFVLNIQISV